MRIKIIVLFWEHFSTFMYMLSQNGRNLILTVMNTNNTKYQRALVIAHILFRVTTGYPYGD